MSRDKGRIKANLCRNTQIFRTILRILYFRGISRRVKGFKMPSNLKKQILSFGISPLKEWLICEFAITQFHTIPRRTILEAAVETANIIIESGSMQARLYLSYSRSPPYSPVFLQMNNLKKYIHSDLWYLLNSNYNH